MVALKYERDVFLLTVKSASYPSQAHTIGLEPTLEVLQTMHREGTAMILLSEDGELPAEKDEAEGQFELNREGNDPTNAIYIADMRIDKDAGYCTLLVNRGDPTAANPAFTKPETNEVRIAEPEDGESVGYSCHVVIGFGSQFMTADGGKTVLEKMPRLSRTVVFRFLNRLLKKYALETGEFEYKPKTGREMKVFRPTLREAAMISNSLRHDLERGYVTSVELIQSNTAFAGLDQNDRIKKVSKRLRITLDEAGDRGGFFDMFGMLQRKGQEQGYDEIQVHVRGLPGNKSVSPRFVVDQMDAADTLYSRSLILTGFEEFLQQCYNNICTAINIKIIAVLRDGNNWP